MSAIAEPVILAVDTGGTMTDSILIDRQGHFLVGKSQSTPDHEATGIITSLQDACRQAGRELRDVCSTLEIVVYSGTIMLNRLLGREGVSPIGLITTAGFEDTIRMARGDVQSWKDLSIAERLHAVSHFPPEPLIEQQFVKGVRERVLGTGHVMIPLYEEDVREAARDLVRRGAKAIIISFLFSFANPGNELRAEEIVREVMAEEGAEIPVSLAHRIHPVFGESGRLNSVVMQVYAAEPSREQFRDLKRELAEAGTSAPVRILTNYGTMVSPEYERLVHVIKSGPTGGLLGTKFLGDVYGIRYLMATDVGGTSFDVGAVLDGRLQLRDQGVFARYWVNLPQVAVDSIGSGTGSYVKVDPVTGRLRIGPESAAYRIGTAWPEGGVETVTVNDANVVLGFLDPDNFLGGQIKLDPERALAEIDRQVAQPLGADPYDAAWGIHNLVNLQMKLFLQNSLLGMGFGPELFHVAAFGGGGPLHAIGYTDGVDFAGVMIPAWAPGFSAFGAACADVGMRHEISANLYSPPGKGIVPGPIALSIMRGVHALLPPEIAAQVNERVAQGEPFEDAMREVLSSIAAHELESLWARLRAEIEEEVLRDGLDPGRLSYRQAARVLYTGMLDDLEVDADGGASAEETLEGVVARFEDTFERIYARAAKSSDFGCTITRAIVTSHFETVKPKLEEGRLVETVPAEALLRHRRIYYDHAWYEAAIYEMERLVTGNVIEGPSVLVAPATTILVPPGYRLFLDRHRVFWAVRPGEDVDRYRKGVHDGRH